MVSFLFGMSFFFPLFFLARCLWCALSFSVIVVFERICGYLKMSFLFLDLTILCRCFCYIIALQKLVSSKIHTHIFYVKDTILSVLLSFASCRFLNLKDIAVLPNCCRFLLRCRLSMFFSRLHKWCRFILFFFFWKEFKFSLSLSFLFFCLFSKKKKKSHFVLSVIAFQENMSSLL